VVWSCFPCFELQQFCNNDFEVLLEECGKAVKILGNRLLVRTWTFYLLLNFDINIIKKILKIRTCFMAQLLLSP
jgi:hypothetical protein